MGELCVRHRKMADSWQLMTRKQATAILRRRLRDVPNETDRAAYLQGLITMQVDLIGQACARHENCGDT